MTLAEGVGTDGFGFVGVLLGDGVLLGLGVGDVEGSGVLLGSVVGDAFGAFDVVGALRYVADSNGSDFAYIANAEMPTPITATTATTLRPILNSFLFRELFFIANTYAPLHPRLFC